AASSHQFAAWASFACAFLRHNTACKLAKQVVSCTHGETAEDHSRSQGVRSQGGQHGRQGQGEEVPTRDLAPLGQARGQTAKEGEETMSVFRRGKSGIYWYDFIHRGRRVQCSTRQGNREVAKDLEADHRAKLSCGDAGIVEREPAPTLSAFAQRFIDYV